MLRSRFDDKLSNDNRILCAIKSLPSESEYTQNEIATIKRKKNVD